MASTSPTPAPPATFPLIREINDSVPLRMYYEHFQRETRPVRKRFHNGQRKLFMAEFEFLSMCISNNTLDCTYHVIYAGSAPGNHIPLLVHFFPQVRFILYDPNIHRLNNSQFNIPSTHFEIHQRRFDDTEAHGLRKRFDQYSNDQPPHRVLFISDIRSTKPADPLAENKILQDMSSQMAWHSIIRPYKSMLKFRPTYSTYCIENRSSLMSYLQGTRKNQIWAPLHSTECRLIVDQDAPIVQYDYVTHESQMFYVNTVIRHVHHALPIQGIDHIYRHAYDDVAEVSVILEYIAKFLPHVTTDQERAGIILHIHALITSACQRRWIP